MGYYIDTHVCRYNIELYVIINIKVATVCDILYRKVRGILTTAVYIHIYYLCSQYTRISCNERCIVINHRTEFTCT